MAARPLILFAHGAGAGSEHPWMLSMGARLSAVGDVRRFDYPSMREGRRRPDRQPVLVDAHRKALATACDGHSGPVVLAGKSMGSRMGCHLSLEEPVDALVCFGYPLQGQGRNPKLRDEVLLGLRTPILFVQGTRDRLCPLDLLEEVRGKMQAPSDLLVVEAGDHSLCVTKRQLAADGETQDDVDDRIVARAREFLAEHAGGAPGGKS